MDFTPEQRAYIDEQLRLADEWQKRNGNKTYTLEEIKEEFSKPINLRKAYNNKLQTYR